MANTTKPRKKRVPITPALGDKLAIRLEGLVASGKTLPVIYKRLGISKPSFDKLMKISPKFSAAYKDARAANPSNAGAPEIFTKSYGDQIAPQIPPMFAEGQGVAEVATSLGFSKETFYKLVGVSPAFAAAYQEGRSRAEAFWTRLGRGGAAGAVKINPAVWIFTMKNVCGWSDKLEHTNTNETAPAPTLDMDSLSTETLEELMGARDEEC